MGKKLDDALAEARELEENPDAIVRSDTRVTRANGKTLQVRLTADEYAAIQELANRRALPVSTLAREVLLAYLPSGNTKSPDTVSLSDALTQISLWTDAIRSLPEAKVIHVQAFDGSFEIVDPAVHTVHGVTVNLDTSKRSKQ
ncbi:hypothetical protein [Williamsia sp.]|uniref:hypothetical protein n=1 Tax=Williamsia sp. TaxID=1872085 RepID=UPI002F91E4E9